MQWVAFLRAINVGGHVVRMGVLRQVFESLGFTQVETFIASGNVMFSASGRISAPLERRIAAGLREALGYEVATFLRTPAEVAKVAATQPFGEREYQRARTFCVAFISSPLLPPARRALLALANDLEDFRVIGREVYWLSRVGQGESKFSNAVFERTTGAPATFRGRSMLTKLAAKLALAAPARAARPAGRT